jgi:exodeoxyribonuclease VII small subunit
MPKDKPAATYEELNRELEAVLADLQREDLDVDEALARYERGLELVKKLETYLKTAENKVQKLKAKFDDGA